MKKQVKYLIGGAIALVVLIVALVATIKLVGPAEEESSSSVNSALFGDSVYLNEGKKVADLTAVTFKNSRGTYTVEKIDDTNFMIDELKETPYDSAKINGIGNFAAAFYASDTASKDENVDLSLYGLNEPRAEITATYADGTEFTLLLGNDAPSNRGVYGKLPDSNTVYVFNHADVDPFLKEFTYLMSAEIAPDYEGYAYGYFKGMTVSGSDIGTDKPIVVDVQAQDEDDALAAIGSMVLSSHNNALANSEYVADVLNTIFPMNAEEIVSVNPSDDELENYGLINPSVSIDLKYTDDDNNDLALTISAGKVSGSSVYVTNEKKNIIYKVKNSTADTSWTNVNYIDIQNKLFLIPLLKNLSSIELVANGEEYLFEVFPYETTDRNGDPKTAYNYTCNGEEVDSKNFAKFYQVMIGMRKDRLTTADSIPSGEPTVKATYHYADSSVEDEVIEFYPSADSDRHCIAVVNGYMEFDTLASHIDKLIDDIQNLLDGKEINTDF